MLRFENCYTYKTGINRPHTIRLNNGVNVSIVYVNKLNKDCTIKYYTKNKNMEPFATATDNKGKQYTILTQYKNNPWFSIIAITEE